MFIFVSADAKQNNNRLHSQSKLSVEQCRLLTELTFFRDSYCIFKSQRSVFLESAVKQLVIAVQLISDSAGPVRALQGRLSGCYASCLSVKTTRV